jgi:hypothetical protein
MHDGLVGIRSHNHLHAGERVTRPLAHAHWLPSCFRAVLSLPRGLRELRCAIDFPSADAGSDLRSADEVLLPYADSRFINKES